MRTSLQSTRICLFVCIIAVFSMTCTRMDDLHNKYLQDQTIYISTPRNIVTMPGYQRIKIRWILSPDSRVIQSKIIWKTDSLVFDTAASSVEMTDSTVVEKTFDLPEGDYDFTLSSLGKDELRSVRKTKSSSVYGPVYQKGLNNRNLKTHKIDSDTLTLVFYGPLADETGLKIRYVDITDHKKEIVLDATVVQSIKIGDYKFNTPIIYSSLFLPEETAIDTFMVTKPDTLYFSKP